MTVRVLFVCLGNICRSPMAEGVFQKLVDEAGLGDQIEVDSAGTGSWHIGEPAHRGTRDILRQHGVNYNSTARQIEPRDFADFDYILAMDDSNLANLRRIVPDDSDATIERFLDFDRDLVEKEVPDPYYNGRFDYVYTLVERGARALLDHIREEEGL